MKNLRVSSYIIPVKLDCESEQYFLIHGYTGAFDIVGTDIKDFLFSNKFTTLEKFPFSDILFNKLKERGYLTSKTKEEEQDYVKRIANVLHKQAKMSPNSYTLVVTYNCNFKCPYCFEKEILKEINKDPSYAISKEMVDKFYDRILEMEPDGKIRNKYISLFGGEPLLKENRDILEYIMEKGQKLGCAFTAATNGYDLDCYEDFLKPGYIERIQITIDGTQKVHDERRMHAIYKNSFDIIVNNIRMALNKNTHISIRINIDNENFNELVLLDKQFKDLGFYDYKSFTVYAAFISGENNFIPDSNKPSADLDINQRNFLDLFKNNNLNMIHDIKTYLSISDVMLNNKNIMFYPYYCSSQSNMYAFDPFGYIYSCLEKVGDKTHAIGQYNDNITWLEEKELWFNRNIGNINKCRKCKYALFCGGGCFTKTFSNNRCPESFCDDFPIIFKYTINEIYNKKQQR